MLKGRALRRAIDVDAVRVNADVPLIADTTELITPAIAQAMLERNTLNRTINWAQVEEYADTMKRGEWAMHSQGIVLDPGGNILTGQKRLWAVVYAGVNVYFRVSRGSPPETAALLDRGASQTARDLASRVTRRKHSPVEASIARAYCAAMGNTKPSVDVLATVMTANAATVAALLDDTRGVKKTRSILMVLAAIDAVSGSISEARERVAHMDAMTAALDEALAPQTSQQVWGRGAAFGLAMNTAQRAVNDIFGLRRVS